MDAPIDHMSERPSPPVLLRALREARGVTQDGWAALLGYGTTTIRRWEAGSAVPSAAAEAAIVAVCRERGLFRTYGQGPLRGLTLTPHALRDLLAQARVAIPRTATPTATVGRDAETTGPPPTNLPAALTSFVGREGAMAEVRQLLVGSRGAGGTRLLTLTGAGGCGKTRLALETAAALHTEAGDDGGMRYPDGVWLVQLAALPAERSLSGMMAVDVGTADEDAHGPPQAPAVVSEASLASAVTAALGVREQAGGSPLASLVEHLRYRRLLLVLDNCEHVIGSCAALVETVLRACRDVQALVTSREVLRADGETAWRVPSLEVPSAALESVATNGGAERGTPDVGPLLRCEAVQLFADRAAATTQEWTLTDGKASAVARICRRLDGIPLALELAAARVRTLSVEQIAARLDDRFRLLIGGNRAALPRHQTLRACIDWSYDLLTPEEQALFLRLAVFAGSFDLDAAEAVCGGDGIDPDAILAVLSGLVDKSLVVAEARDGETRHRLLETMREYARVRRSESPPAAAASDSDTDTLQERHAGWFTRLARRAHPAMTGPEQADWLNRLDTDHDNLRAALQWALDRNQITPGLRLAALLVRFWQPRSFLSEGRDWLDRLLACGEQAPAAVRASALHGAGLLAQAQADYTGLGGYAERCLALQRELDDRVGISEALLLLGIVAHRRAEFATATAHFEEGLALARVLDETRLIARHANALGVIALHEGRYADARSRFEASLATARALGDQRGSAMILGNLAQIAHFSGDLDRTRALNDEAIQICRALGERGWLANRLRAQGGWAAQAGDLAGARQLTEEALAIAQEIGDRSVMAMAHDQLTTIARRAGDLVTARVHATANLEIAREIGDPQAIHSALWEYAATEHAARRSDHAARLFAAAMAQLRPLGGYLPTELQRDLDVYRQQLAAALGADAFAAAWAEGEAMPLDQAIAYACAEVDAEASVPTK